MSARTTAEIRQSFVDYFVSKHHRHLPSSPVIPFNDPTILFTNAGMNQFKEIFTGQRKVDYKRAVTTQKCLRAGGKHNDLDNVGFTARHHTFFEMLGNFSFGDYYKAEAMEFAWEWITKKLGLSPDLLWVSIYESDDEAEQLWKKVAPALGNGRILRFGKKDNFWSMGDVGPCGPNTEIHYDRGSKWGTGPEDVVNGETDRFVEVWNLVFMQYDQTPDGLVPLPKPSVDTGAGLERLAMVVQQTDTNYGIDLFQSIVAAIADTLSSDYAANKASHHVIADHLRALSFSIADGASISNEGRGYVLRRIMRRAARHGRLLGATSPFMYKLVPALLAQMGKAYPELVEHEGVIAAAIRTEEESFARTLETGLELFSRVAGKLKASGSNIVPGDEVFRLYDTYGFPVDLTAIIAGEQGLTVDQAGFETAMREQQERSRAGASFKAAGSSFANLIDRTDLPPTSFVRESLATSSVVMEVKLLSGKEGEPTVAVILDKTPFYVESGGQISDTGRLVGDGVVIEVSDLYKHQDYIIHVGRFIVGTIDQLLVGAAVKAEIDTDRRWAIMRNHTGTHLLHAALRKTLGEHVKQAGSYVGPDRLRFDFSHTQPIAAEQLSEIELLINRTILQGTLVQTKLMGLDEAKQSGAMALFGEKYADTVRVVSIDGFSKELCGGTHVDAIWQIGPLAITLETGVASGVRRIEAITGKAAVDYLLEAKSFRRDLSRRLNRSEHESMAAVIDLQESLSDTQKELKKAKAAQFSGKSGSIGTERTVGSLSIVHHDFGQTDRDTMSAWIDAEKGRAEARCAVAFGDVDGKKTVLIAATSKAIESSRIDLSKTSKELFARFGGRGGGKPSFVQGTVADGVVAEELFNAFFSTAEAVNK